jgi:hypothetical protein
MAKLTIDDQDLASEIIKLQQALTGATVSIAAGAANTMVVTVQHPVKAVRELEVYFSDSATGVGLTATAFSGTLAATTGVIKDTPTAAKSFVVLTDATGKFVGVLTATGKPATVYTAVVNPDGLVVVSPISGTNWG